MALARVYTDVTGKIVLFSSIAEEQGNGVEKGAWPEQVYGGLPQN